MARRHEGRAPARNIAIAAALIAIFAAQTACARTAILSGARIRRTGQIVELRFLIKGQSGRCHLSVHGNQLWIDIHQAIDGLPSGALFESQAPPISSVHATEPVHGRARVVITVSGKSDYAMMRLPHEIAVRVAPAGAVPDLAAPLLAGQDTGQQSLNQPKHDHAISQPAKRAETPAASSMEYAALRAPAPPSANGTRNTAVNNGRRPIVVIDPGHGGFDPGTEIGAPIIEKTVALRISLKLADALIARGIDARLTRNADTFVTLAGRTKIANQDRADLFISIHLNSSPDPDAAGIETYYLNNTTDRATIRLAHMENASGGGRYGAPPAADLNYILSDLRQQYKAVESASLARMIETSAVRDLDAGLGIRINELGAKQGPFYVLVGAAMPAVLVECGFLSNRAEAQRLVSPRYQQLLAGGIADAVVEYFNSAVVGNL
ncbi:MAG: N-acetylmuramoyl-L-alanine amidase family protein [Candidatus Binataceae bacterium]